MSHSIFRIVFSSLGLIMSGAVMAQDGDVEPRARDLLEEMGEHLQSADEFSFEAQVTYDAVRENGQKIQFGDELRVWLRRSDGFMAEVDGDEYRRRIYLDDTRLTVFDVTERVYAVTEVPSGIDAALDFFFERHGFSVPLADFLYSDPYGVLIENVDGGMFVGEHSVDGRRAFHLAFTQDAIDWQIWIDSGPRPLPLKLLLTYKDEPGEPQYTARLTMWDFAPRLGERAFEFDPPADSDPIDFLPEAIR